MSALESLDRNMPILVVDDFATMRKIVKNCLKQLGFSNFADAENGETALQLLDEKDFQLVICDWYMPGMSGLDLLEVVKENEKLSKVPFLMVTAEAQKDKVEQAARKQEFKYIIKPFTSEVLEAKIEELFGTNGNGASTSAAKSTPPGANLRS